MAQLHKPNFPTAGGGETPTQPIAEGKGPPKTFWQDITNASVNNPDTAEFILKTYKGMWSHQQDVDALKVYNISGERQLEVWDYVNGKPGELLEKSVDYAAYNCWTNTKAYIINNLHPPGGPSVIPIINVGEQGYRPMPGMPGYYGPYWDQVPIPAANYT